MAGGKFSEAPLFGMTIRESANDGSDFTNPAADYRRVFLGEDGELHSKDSAGAVAGFAGSGIQATLADAQGDLLVASAADTWAKLALGASGTIPRSNGTTIVYAFPPGHEFDYTEITSSSTTTATSEGTATTVITGGSVTYDGSTVILVELSAPYILQTATATGQTHVVDLYDGATILGRIINQQSPAAAAMRNPCYAARRLTPSAASHQYIVKHWITAGTNGQIAAGAGGTGAVLPAFLRVTKV